MAKIDVEEFNKLKEEGMLYIQKHPELEIFLAKYLPVCTYLNNWNEHTLRARGIVFDVNGNVITNSMPKFFNWDQHNGESNIGSIPVHENFKIFNKEDGNLICVGWYQGKPVITSSGSFISDHQKKACELLYTKYEVDFDIMKTEHQDKTFIFEMLVPKFRIVVDNGDQETLVLLAIRDTEIGKEYDIESPLFEKLSFPRPEMYKADNVDGILALQKKNLINKEGFVVLFESGFRVKLKYENYVQLHRFFTMTRKIDLWEVLKSNDTIENKFSSLLSNIPDEFYETIKKHEIKFKDDFQEHKISIEKLHYEILHNENLVSRKEIASYVLTNHKLYAPMIFKILDNKDYSTLIWDLIKPNNLDTLF